MTVKEQSIMGVDPTVSTTTEGNNPNPHDCGFNVLIQKYVLNKNKALEKKLDACDRVDFSIKTKGANVVIEFDTYNYELFRIVVGALYSEVNFIQTKVTSPVMILSSVKLDDDGHEVERSFKICHKNFRGEVGRCKYTVNMYHTTCRALINGAARSLFVENDLPRIRHAMNSLHSVTPQDTPDHLKAELIRALSEQGNEDGRDNDQLNQDTTNHKNTRRRRGKMSKLLPLADPDVDAEPSDDVSKVKSVLCPSCNLSADTDTIECSNCLLWYHFECEAINDKIRKDHEKDPQLEYKCLKCKSISHDIFGMSDPKNIILAITDLPEQVDSLLTSNNSGAPAYNETADKNNESVNETLTDMTSMSYQFQANNNLTSYRTRVR